MPLGTIIIVMSLWAQQRSYATYRPPHNIPFTLWQNVLLQRSDNTVCTCYPGKTIEIKMISSHGYGQ